MVAGVSLIISGMNMVNFGQGAFYVLGTYLTYTIAAKLGFVPALFIVPLIVAGIGYFVEKATRPLFGKNMLYIMLLTYGVAYMVSMPSLVLLIMNQKANAIAAETAISNR